MADEGVRLVGPAAMATSSTLLYTCGVTKTWVRELRVVNTTASPITFKLSVGVDAAGARLVSDAEVPANGIFKESGLVTILDSGGTLYGHAASSGLTIQLCGVEST